MGLINGRYFLYNITFSPVVGGSIRQQKPSISQQKVSVFVLFFWCKSGEHGWLATFAWTDRVSRVVSLVGYDSSMHMVAPFSLQKPAPKLQAHHPSSENVAQKLDTTSRTYLTRHTLAPLTQVPSRHTHFLAALGESLLGMLFHGGWSAWFFFPVTIYHICIDTR